MMIQTQFSDSKNQNGIIFCGIFKFKKWIVNKSPMKISTLTSSNRTTEKSRLVQFILHTFRPIPSNNLDSAHPNNNNFLSTSLLPAINTSNSSSSFNHSLPSPTSAHNNSISTKFKVKRSNSLFFNRGKTFSKVPKHKIPPTHLQNFNQQTK